MKARARWVVLCMAAVAACGGDDDNNRPVDAALTIDAAPMMSMTIGAAGGTVAVPGGPTVTVPQGALAMDVTITISASLTQVPGAVSGVWHFAPEGLTFAIPATVFFPVANPMDALGVYWSMAAGAPGYEELASTQTTAGVTAPITHFSEGYVAPQTPPTAVGTHNTYVISAIHIPMNNTEARSYSVDLDGDNTNDNQLGMVFATLSSQGFDSSAATDVAVDRGTILMLGDLITTSYSTATAAGFRTYLGATPSPSPCMNAGDQTCRKHLAGTGTFTVSAMDPSNAPLVGNFISGTLLAGPGRAVVQVAMNPGRVMTLDLIGARVKISGASAAGLTGVLGGGLTEAELDQTFIPEFAFGANAAIAADCTGSGTNCGCVSNSTGATQQSLFDANDDCVVTDAEIKSNSLITSLLAPDLVLEGQQVLSLGVGFTAVKGTFTP